MTQELHSNHESHKVEQRLTHSLQNELKATSPIERSSLESQLLVLGSGMRRHSPLLGPELMRDIRSLHGVSLRVGWTLVRRRSEFRVCSSPHTTQETKRSSRACDDLRGNDMIDTTREFVFDRQDAVINPQTMELIQPGNLVPASRASQPLDERDCFRAFRFG